MSNWIGKSIWQYVFLFNTAMLCLFGFLFGWEYAGYSILFQFISTTVKPAHKVLRRQNIDNNLFIHLLQQMEHILHLVGGHHRMKQAHLLGVLYGLSVAVALRGNASTAGMDFIALYVSNWIGKSPFRRTLM